MPQQLGMAPPPEAPSPQWRAPRAFECWVVRMLLVILMACLGLGVVVILLGGLIVAAVTLSANGLIGLLHGWRLIRPRLRRTPHPWSRWS